ncbi:polyprenol phosphomannose-dependent alpha 1,6 mannosyltransferase MptB [Actinoplanes sp. TRM 88003]|uniref:Polyprenol phosphomannose-dependent alpha 1,6 mannosyltransferase MptB n=1 Tax=Paractinoplanes aksuensis TaxID=2939490 RepID=A0ABT1DPL9_9ACTN|nr:polyprenol phosphomannose-dependent alpha 1,6 mannosyltransferase MptB [Actinoplanes aksuensis]MCO8272791.1 polyprenol phosphomannose-dependent alpha 1,6 mannosyltransferase MptB [Actinoplanes aksuensis]
MSNDHARKLARVTGFAGSCLIAVGGLGAGALPVGIPFFAGLKHVRIGLFAVYGGLLLLLLAWWWLGRLSRAGDTRAMWRTAALWAAPLLIAPPLFSRDVYSYLAQGRMLGEGFDVYRTGPSALGGFFAEQVPAIWQHTPSPYGPVFLLLSELVAAPIGGHLLTGVIAMRLLAVVGLALLAYVIPPLATAAGVPPHQALWLAVLNPLVLIHFVGGAHNDALMVGLLAAGLAAAVRNRPLVATVLVVAAALIKAPAVLGLLAVAVIWASRLDGRLPRLRASAGVGATAAAATAVLTQIAGTGYGWISALDTPISPENLSLTGVLGRWTADRLRGDGVGELFVLDLWRWLGVLATLVVVGLVRAYLDRLGPVYGLGVVLAAVVAFGPALRPWYLIWALVPLAAAAGHRWVRRALAASCAVMALVVLPDGFAVDATELLLAVLGGLTGCAVFLAVRLAAAPAAGRLLPARAAR